MKEQCTHIGDCEDPSKCGCTQNRRGKWYTVKNVDMKYLPFKDVEDLLLKVRIISAAYEIARQRVRDTLSKAEIQFKELDDYSFTVDVSTLSEFQMDTIKNLDNSLIQKVYDENGVISELPTNAC